MARAPSSTSTAAGMVAGGSGVMGVARHRPKRTTSCSVWRFPVLVGNVLLAPRRRFDRGERSAPPPDEGHAGHLRDPLKPSETAATPKWRMSTLSPPAFLAVIGALLAFGPGGRFRRRRDTTSGRIRHDALRRISLGIIGVGAIGLVLFLGYEPTPAPNSRSRGRQLSQHRRRRRASRRELLPHRRVGQSQEGESSASSPSRIAEVVAQLGASAAPGSGRRRTAARRPRPAFASRRRLLPRRDIATSSSSTTCVRRAATPSPGSQRRRRRASASMKIAARRPRPWSPMMIKARATAIAGAPAEIAFDVDDVSATGAFRSRGRAADLTARCARYRLRRIARTGARPTDGKPTSKRRRVERRSIVTPPRASDVYEAHAERSSA